MAGNQILTSRNQLYRLGCIMADQNAHSPSHDPEIAKASKKCLSPVVYSALKNITTAAPFGGNDTKIKTKKKRASSSRLRPSELVDHRATQENTSPVGPSVDCSSQHQKTASKLHRSRMNNIRLGQPGDVLNVHSQHTAGYVDLPSNRSGHVFDTGMRSEDVNFFALHHPKSATVMSMNTGNFSLKTQVSQLLYDNEELNHRFHQINHKNQVLTVERERLLTTIRNTSAILQSTFSSVSHHDKDSEKLQDGKHEKENRCADFKSSNSDSLERSTMCTIKEFDNLLSALHGRKSKKDRFEQPTETNISQYDIIVKWLNNRPKTTWRSDEESSSNEVFSASSSENEFIHHEQDEDVREQDELNSTALIVPSPSTTLSRGMDPHNIPTPEDIDSNDLKIEMDQNPNIGCKKTPERLSHSIDNHGNSECAETLSPPVKQNQLLSEYMKKVDTTALTLVTGISFHSSHGENRSVENRPAEEPLMEIQVQKSNYNNNADENENCNEGDNNEPEPMGTIIAIPLSGSEIIKPTQIRNNEESCINTLSLANKAQPLQGNMKDDAEEHTTVKDNENGLVQNWLLVPQNLQTPIRLDDQKLQQVASELENQSECCLPSDRVMESTKLEEHHQSSQPDLEEYTSPTTNNKKEFLQDWLRDLRARTEFYSQKSQYAYDSSAVHSTTSKWVECKTKSNPIEEHEEFIALCKTMMNRMDLMISKAAKCQRNHEFLGPSGSTFANIANNTTTRIHQSKTPSYEAGLKKRKMRDRNTQPTFLSQDGVSNVALEFNSISSSTSSNFSLTDLANINADLKSDDYTNLHMFQKCLANLEEMNMRRTNNALTQTLIIKVLRKLMASKQFREDQTHRSNRSRKLSTTNIESTTNSSVAPESMPYLQTIEKDEKNASTVGLARKNSNNVGCAKATSTLACSNPEEERDDTTKDMIHAINHVSRSIIYQNTNNSVGVVRPLTTACDSKGVKQIYLETCFAPNINSHSTTRKSTIIGVSDECRKPNLSKILLQLRQLEMEEERSMTIPLYWFYFAIGLTCTLFQSSIFRLFKYPAKIFRSLFDHIHDTHRQE